MKKCRWRNKVIIEGGSKKTQRLLELNEKENNNIIKGAKQKEKRFGNNYKARKTHEKGWASPT